MRRDELLHVLRAADGVVNGRVQFVIIGSQAILGTAEPDSHLLVRSMEADLVVDVASLDEAERYADLVSGTIGDGSTFKASLGFHSDEVEVQTAKLPEGWRQRLVAAPANGRLEEVTHAVGLICDDQHDSGVERESFGRGSKAARKGRLDVAVDQLPVCSTTAAK
ncbi:MAG: hypothetical protein M3414_06270 [Pseudomonadota bacterium]|nr:hypothetical protein [Pseudomonadota bacterium]